MLMSSQALRYAHQLLDARAQSRIIPRISESEPLSVEDAYEIAHNIRNIRVAQGEQPIGRKIGFTNRGVWDAQGITGPIWNYMYAHTVREIGAAFIDKLGVPRDCVVLTYVPTRENKRATADALATSLGFELVSPRLDDLRTFDGSHLDPASAERFAAAFLEVAGPRLAACANGGA